MNKLIFVGDPHLDKLANLFPDKHLDLQFAAYRPVFMSAISEGIKTVIIGGDISDKPHLSVDASIALYTFLNEFDGQLNIHIILGNHDVKDVYTHSLKFFTHLCDNNVFKTIHIYVKPKLVKIDGVYFSFLPFPYTQPLRSKPHIVVAHLERPNSIRDNGSVSKSGVHLDKKDKNVWLIGHLHTRQKSGKNYWAGTLYQTNFGESLPKGYLKLDFNRKGYHKCYFIKTKPPFILKTVIIKKKSDIKKLSLSSRYLYTVYIEQSVRIEESEISERHNVHKYFFYSSDTELKVMTSVDVDYEQNIESFGLTYKLKEHLDTVLTENEVTKAFEFVELAIKNIGE